MNRLILYILLTGMLFHSPAAAQEYMNVSPRRTLPYWQDVNVVQVNKEYPRTQFMTFDSREDALQKKFDESNYYISLNGTWNFY